jgi:pimeloyl-ACP methyl ester carboxylesterase
MEIIDTKTRDGIQLHGLLVRSRAPRNPTLVHVHGKCGNFYQNRFVHIFADACRRNGLGFLAMNTRGRDCLGDIVRPDRMDYIGGSVEKFADSLHDVATMYDVAKQQSDEVVLQGHSFGCEKILYFASELHPEIPLVLLSPSNSRAVQESYTGLSIKNQLTRLRSTTPDSSATYEWHDLVAPNEYGVRSQGIDYAIPISRRALVDLLTSPAMRILDPAATWLPATTLRSGMVYLGGQDPYCMESTEVMFGHLERCFRTFHRLYHPEGDHHFTKLEEFITQNVLSWVMGHTAKL